MPDFFDYDAEAAKVNDVTLYGGVNDDLANHTIRLSYSKKGAKMTRPGEWRVWEGTVGQFVHNFSKFEVGPKDGMCILQGEAINGNRTAKAMRQLDVLLMDHDTGVTFNEVCQQAEDSGIWTFVWTTHSHGKATSSIKLNEFTKRKRDNDFYVEDREDLTDEIIFQYLTLKKGYLPAVLEDLTWKIVHTDQGEEVIVKHKPMDKCRSMRILKNPFVLQDRPGGVEGAMKEWKTIIEGASQYLKSPQYDASCTDTSRLMYTPRIPKGAEIGPGNHRMAVINGDFLDLDDIPRVASKNDIASKFMKAAGSAGGGQFQTKGLLKFVKDHGHMFDMATWLEDIAPEDVVDQRGAGGIHFLCPNWESHTTHIDGETSFMVLNGPEENNGFAASCRHAGCIEASGNDRVWYLDQLCQKYGVTDAHELTQWVADYEERPEEEKSEAELSIKDVKADIQAAIERDDESEMIVLPATLANKYKGLLGKREIIKLIKSVRSTKERDIDVNEYDGPILASMGYSDKNAVAVKHVNRICRADHDPRVFSRPEGGAIRMKFVGDPKRKLLYQSVEMTTDQWTTFLGENIKFLQKGEDDTMKEVAPFQDVVKYISTLPDSLRLEVLDRVVGVPVFSSDGKLRMAEGYDKNTQCYIRTKDMEVKSVKKNPSQRDVDFALYLMLEELMVGFPFTDDFSSADPKPIWENQEEFKLNFKRGRGSRINALAMMLQPFVRNMIDGPTPAYVIDKPENGMGATTLAELVGILIDGESTRVRSGNNENTEMKKGITAALRAGANIIFMDNCNERIDSGDLAAVLTSGTWTDRILGETNEITFDVKSMFILTGNQMSMSQEMVRRFCPIRIHYPDTDVLGRTKKDFKHVDIKGWAKQNRQALVWACHTLIQNWVAKGMKKSKLTIPSYEAWSGVMGGIIEAAGIEHALMSNWQSWRAAQGKDFDFATGIVSKLLHEDVIQLDTPFTTRHIVDMCFDDSKRAFDTIEVPPMVARSTDVGRATSNLGRWISKDLKGRILSYAPDPDQPGKTIKVTWSDNGQVNGIGTWVVKKFELNS